MGIFCKFVFVPSGQSFGCYGSRFPQSTSGNRPVFAIRLSHQPKGDNLAAGALPFHPGSTQSLHRGKAPPRGGVCTPVFIRGCHPFSPARSWTQSKTPPNRGSWRAVEMVHHIRFFPKVLTLQEYTYGKGGAEWLEPWTSS